MIRPTILALAALVVCQGSIRADGPEVPFIISYWFGPPKKDTNLERYKEVAECGFNVVLPAVDADWKNGDSAQHNQKILDLCQKVGLKAFVWGGLPEPKNSNLDTHVDGLVAAYSKHPALLGYFLLDEPNIKQLDRFGAIHQALLKRDPKHIPYINLWPNYATEKELQTKSYDEYLAKYVEIVKPVLLCWDHYRQIYKDGDESLYWKNLETMRSTSLKAKIPMLQVICSLKHWDYRDPSEADLRWQVYTSLAYGSRGIMYFTYWDNENSLAMIGKDGKRTPKYDYAKTINHRIAKLGPTLVGLTSTGAYCTAPMPPGAVKLPADAIVTKASDNLLIGCFKDAAGKQYVFPVNRSFKDRTAARMTFDPKTRAVTEISQGSALPPAIFDRGVLTVPLEAGEGRLFVIAP